MQCFCERWNEWSPVSRGLVTYSWILSDGRKCGIWVQFFPGWVQILWCLLRSVLMQWPYWQEGLYLQTLTPFSWNFQELHVFQPILLLNSENIGQELQQLPGATGGQRNWHKINKTLQDNVIFLMKCSFPKENICQTLYWLTFWSISLTWRSIWTSLEINFAHKTQEWSWNYY